MVVPAVLTSIKHRIVGYESGRPGQSGPVDFDCAPHSRAALASDPLPTWPAAMIGVQGCPAVDEARVAGRLAANARRFFDKARSAANHAKGTHLAPVRVRRGENLIAVCRGSHVVGGECEIAPAA